MKFAEIKWIMAAIVLLAAIAAGVYLIKPVQSPSCFRFDDGTPQNWTLDQLYNIKTNQPITTVVPGNPPNYTTYTPFTLGNSQNVALEIHAPMYLIADNQVTGAYLYLESPDLSADPEWQNIEGYELDMRREFAGKCWDPPTANQVQMQLRIVDLSDKSEHLIQEVDNAGKPVFHILPLNQPYHHPFIWGPTIKLSKKELKPSEYQVKNVRIRIFLPGYTPKSGECPYQGSWKIGNVCPVKKKSV